MGWCRGVHPTAVCVCVGKFLGSRLEVILLLKLRKDNSYTPKAFEIQNQASGTRAARRGVELRSDASRFSVSFLVRNASCILEAMTETEIKKALAHLKKDARLKNLIARYPKPEFDRGQKGLKAFQALTRAIIFQQLSGKAARTILDCFLIIYDKKFPTPDRVLKTPVSKMRSAGISNQKAGYLKDLASKFKDGTVNPRKFRSMTDDEVFEHVVSVKGIGPWTCHMFLMFTLGRPDVLPTGDLGIQKGMQRLFKLRTLPSPEKMQKLVSAWRPYRTVACWYLWRLGGEGNAKRSRT